MDKNFLKYLMKKNKKNKYYEEFYHRVLNPKRKSIVKSGIWSKPTWDQNWALKPLCIEN